MKLSDEAGINMIRFSLVIGCLLMIGCRDRISPRFISLTPSQSGVDFSNTIITDADFNALNYEYIYNGGGVGIGDLNGDDLPDLVFAGNQVTSRIYINRGKMKFEDAGLRKGFQTKGRWCTGVSLVDINDDGRLDIYICLAGFNVDSNAMANLLFINQGNDESGIPGFLEQAESYGLADRGYSTQAAFFDYDLDGDLDMYLLTNGLEKQIRNNLRPKRVRGEAPTTDRLYRNDGNDQFSNVSSEAGIQIEGYGLGVVVCDINSDGFPDVYAANDFLANDLLWINNRDGTFSNHAGDYLKHQTHNGMGTDIADFNNDELPDIAVLDMLPEDNYRQKMMIPFVNRDRFKMNRNFEYEDQYMRNTLQLNQGRDIDNKVYFSEIGNLAGIAATDWSWSVLFADFDNNGWKDVFITNGYRKDVTNLDYINYSSYNQIFGTVDSKAAKAVEDLENAPDIPLKNVMFQNTRTIRFNNVTDDWGFTHLSFSNGAAYADLDLDGDLDLVINNIDQPAFIYQNQSTTQDTISQHYLRVVLQKNGPKVVTHNAKVWLHAGGTVQFQDYTPYRGYKSTMGQSLHFGLGAVTQIDSLIVKWLDGSLTKRYDLSSDQELIIQPQLNDDSLTRDVKRDSKGSTRYVNITFGSGIEFTHGALEYDEFKHTRTLLFGHSTNGPAICTGDMNGDGLDDVFIGGNVKQSAMIFLQNRDYKFWGQSLQYDEACQDADAAILDLNGDGDLDLYVVSGGSHLPEGHPDYQDRVYINEGGLFKKDKSLLPAMKTSGSCVRIVDFDNDGDPDLFIGGYVHPDRYPKPERSYLLKNNQGILEDVTPSELRSVGIVRDANWADLDLDGYQDLIVAGEWMPVTVFRNNQGVLQQKDIRIVDEKGQDIRSNGFWFHINSADLDNDGDPDLVLGNLGENSMLVATQDHPIRLYAQDLDRNGKVDPLVSCYIGGKRHLLHERDLLISQVPGLKKIFPNYKSYASASMEDIIAIQNLADSSIYNCHILSSIVLFNEGMFSFRIKPLPVQSQLAPITTSLVEDLNQDGQYEIITAGNLYESETTQIGKFDAGFGNIISIQETNMTSFSAIKLGLKLDQDQPKLIKVHLGDGNNIFIVAGYQAPVAVYRQDKNFLPLVN